MSDERQRTAGQESGRILPLQTRPDGSSWREYLAATGVILAVTAALYYAQPLIGYHTVAWVLLVAVVVMAAFVGRGATFLAALLSALLWNFLFEPPVFSFVISSLDDQVLFVSYLVVAVVLGELTAQIRRQERAERVRNECAAALQRLTREVMEAAGFDDLPARAVQQTAAVFEAQVALLLPSSTGQFSPHPAGTFQMPGPEGSVANWAHEKGRPAGRFTANFPEASALYLPMRAYGEKLGVLGVRLSQPQPPGVEERKLMEAFAEQIALAIHRFRLREAAEKSQLLAESERLSKTLLNSLSHEIRTPLAVIDSATAYLADFEKAHFNPTQMAMIQEIQQATERLNRLMGKVIGIARLESGLVRPKLESSEVSELIQMAEDAARRELAQHKVTIEIAPDLPLVPMDFELMLHSLTNLLSNAGIHTPPGTEVEIRARVEEGALLLTVADSGPGIPAEALARLFEKFYRAPAARTGGTGLGLSIVKGFVEAQGGRVTAENRASGGAAFTIRLPLNQGPQK